MRQTVPTYRATLQSSATKTADFTGANLGEMDQYSELIVTLDVTAADRGDVDETYDVYITTTGPGGAAWDIAHFAQIATTGPKRFTARIRSDRFAEVTTATPGVAAEASGTFKVDTAAAAEGIKTLGAGKVRHGPWGALIGHELDVAGTTPSITYSISIEARRG
jgi:hypothetical protein